MTQLYHKPVLLSQSVGGLRIQPAGVYVDVTFGGGGHSREILRHLNNEGRLIAFDQDADAKQNLIHDSRFEFIPENFRYLKQFLKLSGIVKVDGIIADLGVSSHQFDETARGFSIHGNARLDMRMDNSGGETAADILNGRSENELVQIFSAYGEMRNSKSLANFIVHQRTLKPFEFTAELIDRIKSFIKGDEHRYLAQLFQALRIAVNKELEALEQFLIQSLEVLKTGGRLVVISYHSLEDRMVKNFMRSGNTTGEVVKDVFGNENKVFELITRKPIVADDEEMKLNSRSRSAHLRIAEKI